MSAIVIKKFGIKKSRRVGRGVGSGKGRYSGRGQKGQKSRSGGNIPPRYEGGQMPLYRRTPKRGFKNPFRVCNNIVNLSSLGMFPEGSDVTVELMKQKGLIKNNQWPVKLLADGELKVKGLKISVHKCSEEARKKIETLGGQIVILAPAVAKRKAASDPKAK